MSEINDFKYEELIALQKLSDMPDMEGMAICLAADCSISELFHLADAGLIEIGNERLEPKKLHPIITSAGIKVLTEAKQNGVI